MCSMHGRMIRMHELYDSMHELYDSMQGRVLNAGPCAQ